MKWWAILAQRCPRCRRGRVFQALWKMHPACPQCDLVYEREPGFFYGAMYFSYGIGIVLAAPVAVTLFVWGMDEKWIFGVVLLQLALLSPWLFRISRVAWLHFDQRFDPR